MEYYIVVVLNKLAIHILMWNLKIVKLNKSYIIVCIIYKVSKHVKHSYMSSVDTNTCAIYINTHMER